jgi:2-succinyl-6-hydroxy-2,4-cyclohexadiene-1-carboxylate synthase
MGEAMGVMEVNGITYAYGTYGGPGGEPVLLLHGFFGCRSNWETLARELAANRFHAIAVDLPGHGDTSSPPEADRYRIERVAADLLTLLDKLGFGRIHLLGYSMGGRTALTFASLYSERLLSLVLESSSPGLPTEEERRQRRESDAALADQIEARGLEWFADYWSSLPLFATMRRLDKGILGRIREQRMRQHPSGLANSLRGMGTGSQPSWWDGLPRLNLPVLLIAGEEDEKYAAIAERMRALLPAAEKVIVPGAGHNVHLEKPDVFRDVVISFFRQLRGKKS